MKKLLLLSLLCSNTLFAHDIPRYFEQTDTSYQSQIPYGNNAQAGKFAPSDNAQIYYEVYGKGKPLVILHSGLVGSIGEMGEFIDKLSASYQVIAINTRGHGKSTAHAQADSYEQKATDVANVLKSLNITEPATLIGFSDGAYTGYYFAAQYPTQIAKLVAIGAGEWKKAWRDFNLPFAQLEMMDNAYWQEQIALRQGGKTALEQWYQAQTQYYNQVEIGKAIFEQVKTPTLVLAGEDDANAPLDSVIQAYKWLPNADLAIIPNAPHQVFLTNFPAVWAVVEPFLRDR